MEIKDLSVEDQNLVNTQFPESLEKEAAAEAGAAMELYGVGFNKLAAQSADELDKIAAEGGDEEEGEGKKEEKKEMDEEEEKEASARGAFIARGFINGLKKQGADRHEDEFHYLTPMIQEKLASVGYELEPEQNLEKEAKGKAGMFADASKSLGKLKGKVGKHLKKHQGKYYAGAGGAGAGGLGAYAAMKDKKK